MPYLEFQPKLMVEANLKLNEHDIQVLEYLFGYNMVDLMKKYCTKRFTDEELEKVFLPLRTQLTNIIKMTKDERKKLFPKEYGS